MSNIFQQRQPVSNATIHTPQLSNNLPSFSSDNTPFVSNHNPNPKPNPNPAANNQPPADPLNTALASLLGLNPKTPTPDPTMASQYAQNRQNQNPDNSQPQPRYDADGNEIITKPIDPAKKLVEGFLDPRIREDFTTSVDKEALLKAFQSGDIEGFLSVFNDTGTAIMKTTMEKIVSMLPQFAASIKSQMLQEVQGMNSNETTWNSFVQSHPQFADFKSHIAPGLKAAMEANPNIDKTTLFEAYAMINSGLVQATNRVKPSAPNAQNRQQRAAGAAFDFASFLGMEG